MTGAVSGVAVEPERREVRVTVDPAQVRSAHHRELVEELTRLSAGSPMSPREAKRARHLMRVLMRYGIVVFERPKESPASG